MDEGSKSLILEQDELIRRSFRGDRLLPEEIHQLCERVSAVLHEEKNVLCIDTPCTICGDIHGQFFDLVELFHIAGCVPDTNFLFLGDYVDRGYHSIECVVLLFSLKVRYPNRIYLLRGNHESRFLSRSFGFYQQCLNYYGNDSVWNEFMKAFDCLPLCAVVNKHVFAVHAGISPKLQFIRDIDVIDRFQEIPEGLFCDLLWSDPAKENGWNVSTRGISQTYGPNESEDFLILNGLKYLIRGHEAVMTGYVANHHNKVFTVFSAPNYCYYVGNMGAFVEVDELGYLTFHQYRSYSS
ncbi:hypothetical protein BLSTO_03918 [Blastocystis sp. subtype 1]